MARRAPAATAIAAACSSVAAARTPSRSTSAAAAPRKQAITGLPAGARARQHACRRLRGAGGLETSTMTRVPGSAASSSIARSIVAPPTSALQVASAGAERVRYADARPDRRARSPAAAPCPRRRRRRSGPCAPRWRSRAARRRRSTVPQSGPITSSPRASDSRLSSISSARLTLSLNSITFRPSRSALSASAAAYSPGVEMSARVGVGLRLERHSDAARRALPRRASSARPPRRRARARARLRRARRATASSLSPCATASRSLGRSLDRALEQPRFAQQVEVALGRHHHRGLAYARQARRYAPRAASATRSRGRCCGRS